MVCKGTAFRSIEVVTEATRATDNVGLTAPSAAQASPSLSLGLDTSKVCMQIEFWSPVVLSPVHTVRVVLMHRGFVRGYFSIH